MNTLINVFSTFIKSAGGYALALLIGGVIGFGVHWIISTGSAAKQEVKTLQGQAKDNEERAGITTEVVSNNEQARHETQKTMRVIHAQIENYITADDNPILPAGAVRMYDDFVLRRIPGASGIIDASAEGTNANH